MKTTMNSKPEPFNLFQGKIPQVIYWASCVIVIANWTLQAFTGMDIVWPNIFLIPIGIKCLNEYYEKYKLSKNKFYAFMMLVSVLLISASVFLVFFE